MLCIDSEQQNNTFHFSKRSSSQEPTFFIIHKNNNVDINHQRISHEKLHPLDTHKNNITNNVNIKNNYYSNIHYKTITNTFRTLAFLKYSRLYLYYRHILFSLIHTMKLSHKIIEGIVMISIVSLQAIYIPSAEAQIPAEYKPNYKFATQWNDIQGIFYKINALKDN